MGAEVSSMNDFQLGQPYFSNSESALKVTVCPATNSADGKKYTTFQYPKERGKLDEAAEKHLEIIRTTRHPHILKYITAFEDSKHTTLVTEHVVPLDVAVEKQGKEEIFAGLYNILEAVIFLHERSMVCHNGISVSSVFITDNGVWKLSSFENSNKVLRLSKQSYENDITGYAEFALSVLEYLKDVSQDTVNFMQKLEDEFIGEDKEVLGSLKLLSDDTFFKFPFLYVIDGLQNIALKSSAQKIQFFKSLDEILRALPPYVVGHRFIPILFSHIIITDPIADDLLLCYIFSSGNDHSKEKSISPIFDQDHFIKYSLPLITSLYKSRDVVVRLIIMKYLPFFADCIDKEILKKDILPELLLGLKDPNDTIVTATFKALAHLVPVLGGHAVVGGECMTYFYNRQPDFSRSRKAELKGKKSPQTVVEVMRPTTNSPRALNSDNVTEEKKQRRMEREKQREEQRRKREERRKEREATKVTKLQKQSSDEASVEFNESSFNQSVTFELNSELIVKNSHNLTEEHDGNHSEPDWEGFEAFSYGSESETKYSVESDHLVSVTEHQEDAWAWNDAVESENVSHREEKLSIIKNITTKPSEVKPAKSKRLSLANTKQIKPSSDLNSVDNTKQTTKQKSIDLGGEFDIKIDKGKLKEIDFFADMVPSIDKGNTKTVVIDTNVTDVSSKFNAMEMGTQEVSGWDGDDDGWGNDDDFL